MIKGNWKQQEREIAKEMGDYHRMPNVGKGQPDIIAGPWAVQVKKRKTLPRWFIRAHEQARRDADNKTPLVVFCEVKQGVKAKRYVCMTFEDWLEWYGPTGWARSVCE